MTRRPPPPLLAASLVRSSVVITLTDDSGLRGVLWQADSSGVVLTSSADQPAAYIAPGAPEWEPIPGQVFVPAERIKFMQLPQV